MYLWSSSLFSFKKLEIQEIVQPTSTSCCSQCQFRPRPVTVPLSLLPHAHLDLCDILPPGDCSKELASRQQTYHWLLGDMANPTWIHAQPNASATSPTHHSHLVLATLKKLPLEMHGEVGTR
jgi:hypothetical protein